MKIVLPRAVRKQSLLWVSLVQGEFRMLTLAVVQQAAEIEGLAMVEK